ncbi:response regulator transcription factor [Bacillus cereus]|uniref:response regulator transcription factor n=1 Tax=Bacillus cereus TaxID=1396 RepID=UPI000C282521|nr:response regulator transcription factor [Bacillus cereus]
MGTILVVKDNLEIRNLIVLHLKHAGFNVLEAETGEVALRLIRDKKIDIVLLEVMLPGIDGFEVCKNIRDLNEQMGIIMLSECVQMQHRLKGFELGADDYIEIPFYPREFIARIQSLLRRIKINEKNSQMIQSGPFTLNLLHETAYKNGEKIHLTPTEYIILKNLMNNVDKAVSRRDILEKIWCEHYTNYTGTRSIVAVNIRRLRKKLEKNPSTPQFLQTVRGIGYMWKYKKKKTI